MGLAAVVLAFVVESQREQPHAPYNPSLSEPGFKDERQQPSVTPNAVNPKILKIPVQTRRSVHFKEWQTGKRGHYFALTLHFSRCVACRRFLDLLPQTCLKNRISCVTGKNFPLPERFFPSSGRAIPFTGKNFPLPGKNFPFTGRNIPFSGKNFPLLKRNIPSTGRRVPLSG